MEACVRIEGPGQARRSKLQLDFALQSLRHHAFDDEVAKALVLGRRCGGPPRSTQVIRKCRWSRTLRNCQAIGCGLRDPIRHHTYGVGRQSCSAMPRYCAASGVSKTSAPSI